MAPPTLAARRPTRVAARAATDPGGPTPPPIPPMATTSPPAPPPGSPPRCGGAGRRPRGGGGGGRGGDLGVARPGAGRRLAPLKGLGHPPLGRQAHRHVRRRIRAALAVGALGRREQAGEHARALV